MLRLGVLLLALSCGNTVSADEFSRLSHAVLRSTFDQWKSLDGVSRDALSKLKLLDRTSPGAALVLKTDQGNLSKLIVSWGFRKGPDKPVPVLLVHQYVTYSTANSTQEITTAAGKDLLVFPGFRLDLDYGQIVPDRLGGDLEVTDKLEIRPLSGARLAPLDGTPLPADDDEIKNLPAEGFQGVWQINSDGRWKGQLELAVDDEGKITGYWTSEETQGRYDVEGKLGQQPHQAKWTVTLANAIQTFDACLFTKDQDTFAGVVSLQGQKFGCTAQRVKQPAKK